MHGFCRTPIILWMRSMATLSWKVLSPAKKDTQLKPFRWRNSTSSLSRTGCSASVRQMGSCVACGRTDSLSLWPGSLGSPRELLLTAIPNRADLMRYFSSTARGARNYSIKTHHKASNILNTICLLLQ